MLGILITNFELGIEYVLTELNDPYAMNGQEFLEVVVDIYEQGTHTETYVMWLRVIILDNGNYMIEMKDEGHNNYEDIPFNEAENFINRFVEDYSNPDIGSYEVCSYYLGEDEVPMCMVKRDKDMAEGIFIKLHFFEAQSDGFLAELG